MDELISAASFAGASIGLLFGIFEDPTWKIIIAFAFGGLILGYFLAKIINKIIGKRGKK